jgi:aspartate carbamoyltransferase catalytic subunit
VQYDRAYLDHILSLCDRFAEVRNRPTDPAMRLDGRIIVTFFAQESTRTRMSFESAILRMGGNYISSVNARQFSSLAKGESLKDSVRMIDAYGDLIVLRYDQIGGAAIAAEASRVPVINAGDGMGEHPTQAIVDLATLRRGIGQIDGIHIAMVGDVARSRTVRSLAKALTLFNNVKMTFVSPASFRLPEDVRAFLKDRGAAFDETDDLDEVLPYVDATYMVRTQREYGKDMPIEISDEDCAKFRMTYDRMQRMGSQAQLLGRAREAIVTHPLPRNDEIEEACDTDEKRAAYLWAGDVGVSTREALLLDMMKEETP